MSYDRVYVCHGLERESWTERRQAEQAGHDDHFAAEAWVLHQKGAFVVLSARANFCFDELYLFGQPEHARQFFASGFILRECIIGDVSVGFQHVELYLDGHLVASKYLSATEIHSKGLFRADEDEVSTTCFPVEQLLTYVRRIRYVHCYQ